MYRSVCRTITLSMRPVLPIVLDVNILLHISVQCRTDTQLLPHVSIRKPQALFCDFPLCRSATLPVCCLFYSLQPVAWFPSVLTQPSCFLPVHPKTTHCDALKRKITKSVFKLRFYEVSLFCVSVG